MTGIPGHFSLYLQDDLAAVGPHRHDIVTNGHVDGALKAFLHVQGMGGLWEVAVVDDHGVELISHGEALPAPKYLWPEVVPR